MFKQIRSKQRAYISVHDSECFFFIYVMSKPHFPGDALFLLLNYQHISRIRGLKHQTWCSAPSGEATRALVQNTDVTLFSTFDSVTSHQTAEPLLVSRSYVKLQTGEPPVFLRIAYFQNHLYSTRTPLLENGLWLSSTFQFANVFSFSFFLDHDSVCCCLIQDYHMGVRRVQHRPGP